MFRLIFLRIIRERRLMAVLLLSMCLVTAFLALGPLYLQALSVSDFDGRIESAVDQTFSVTVRNAVPLSGDVPAIVDSTLEEFAGEQRSYATLSGFQCGFIYDETAINNIGGSSYTISCYRPYTYDDIERYFSLTDGRYPQNTDSDIIEAVMTVATAEEGEYAIGHRFIMGGDPNDAITFEIVGLIEPLLAANSPFFIQQTMPFLTETYYTETDVRGDVSFAVTGEAFANQVLSVAEDETYVRQFEVQREPLSAFTANDIEARLTRLGEALRQIHPDVNVSTAFTRLIDDYQRGIEGAQGPVIILSFLVLVLMLYNIVATSSLILEQQSEEWSMMASRGAGHFQLLYVQFLTALMLAIIAALIGPFIAYLIMMILATVGPYAAIIDVSKIGAIPQISFMLSMIAAAIIVLALTIPAWSFASKSLNQLKSSMARAPESPVWARYFLDIIILVAGIAFLARLLSLSTDENLLTVFLNPDLLIDLLADTVSSGLFSDAFNLAGPVLILLGASMLWLRIFPLVVRLIGALFAGGDGLTVRLAFWNVERDPAHYAQLVLLLIGTLALGTSSLALSRTREVGGWTAAYAEVGADATVFVEANRYDHTMDWTSLPDVENAIPLMRYRTDVNGNSAIIGLDIDAVDADIFSDATEPFRLLSLAETDFALAGLELPLDTVTLQMDIYAGVPEDEGIIDTRLNVILEDIAGQTVRVPMTSDQSTVSGEFFTYETESLDFGTQPYRLIGFDLLSEHDTVGEFRHTIYLDNLVVVTASGEAIPVNGFEPDTYDKWNWSAVSRRGQALNTTAFTSVEDIVSEGTHSLRVVHRMEVFERNAVRPATMQYNDVNLPPIPVVVSQSFANSAGNASRFRRPLEIGDSLSANINLATIYGADSDAEFTYHVVGIVANDYPMFRNDERLIFVDYNLLRYRLNSYPFAAQRADQVYDYNTLLFALNDSEPSDAFIDAAQTIDGFVSADYAWVQFSAIQRDPLSNAVTGMLFAGFWVSLFLSLLDFAFYMAITIRRRALSFATLQAIGWNENNLLNLLLVEQLIFISPALIIGIFFGMLLATIILPFLALIGSLQLQIPIVSILLMLVVLALSFVVILRIAAFTLRRLSLNQVMRFGE